MRSSPPGPPDAPDAIAPAPLASLPDREHWTRWLAADLLEDAAARLEHGGGGSATTIALARVFVDLAAEDRSAAARSEEDEAGAPDIDAVPPPEPGVLASLLSMVPRPAAPEIDGAARVERGCSPGVLLMGGPGQGKSTLVQQLCQLHRAALLAPARDTLLPAARNALDLLLATHVTDSVPVPVTPCLPLRIVLRDFAAWLAHDRGDAPTALLRFVVRRFRDRRSPIDAERLTAVLGAHPWLLVLDGLDEVPISGGRPRMLEAVRAWLEAPWAATPHLVVATTRPQGYTGELGDFDARALADLSRGRAFRYASLLVQARHPGQPARQREVLTRLAGAWTEPTSRRLFRTPLQVSMMAALVAEVGTLPADRYRLFSDYHRLMYRRELERPNLAHAELLRDLQKPIDEVHRLAGFWLQARSESDRGAAALLTREELQGLIHLVLERFGYDDEAERAQWVARILEAALERLVLLVHAEQDRYGFEIRSLQELMAAEALANGAEEVVKERMRHVAPIDAWRNVVLFVAGKWLTQTEHLGAFVVHELCPWLNDGIQDEAVRGTLTGSELALDILQDGAARHQRQHVKPLVTLALRLLELPPGEIHQELGLVGAREFVEPLKQALEQRLASEDALSAWGTVLSVADEHAWAAGLAERFWPAEGEARRRIVDAFGTPRMVLRGWLQAKIASALECFPPEYLGRAVLMSALARVDLSRLASASGFVLTILLGGHRGHRRHIRAQGHHVGLSYRLVPMRAPELVAVGLLSSESPPGLWRLWSYAARFANNPSAANLAKILRELADTWDVVTIRREALGAFPWPMQLAVQLAEDRGELLSLAQQLDRGELGDTPSWEEAERRWQGSDHELDTLLDVTSFWPTEGHANSFPWPAAGAQIIARQQLDVSWLHRTIRRYRVASAQEKAPLAYLLLSLLETGLPRAVVSGLISAGETRELLRTVRTDASGSGFLAIRLAPQHVRSEEWASLLDELGRETCSGDDATEDDLARLLEWFRHWPEKLGLLRLLALRAPRRFEHVDIRAVADLVEPRRFPEGSRARFHAALLSIAGRSGDLDDIPLAQILSASIPEDPREASIANVWLWRCASVGLLAALIPLLPRHAWRLASVAVSALHGRRTERSSDLDAPATCERLRLPPPPAPAPPQSQADATPASGPAWTPITSLTLTNLRPFASTEILLPAPASGAGQWIVLVGENGVGKSTVLRAMAFALADGSAAAGALAKSEAPYRGQASGPAKIEVGAGERTFVASIELDREAGREVLSRQPRNGGHRPFVVAYGCHRGSALGDPTRNVLFAPELDIATLFDETKGLAPAESWLTKLKLGAEQDPKGRPAELFGAVQKVLCEVLGVRSLEVLGDGVWVESKATGRARLAALSDGYLTTAGWIVDLLARWIAREQRLGREVPPDFHRTMEGLVLLDEVDLHLHPRWQRRVLQDLKRLFPRLSFVVTTHQPLTLLGADPGEIFVLRREEGGAIAVRQIDLEKGLRADQVLTGEWFGLSTTLDPDTLKLLDEHRQLLRAGAAEGDPRRKALEATLRERLGGFSDTNVEGLVRSVTAEILGEMSERMPAEEREEARERIARIARERLARRNKAAGTGP